MVKLSNIRLFVSLLIAVIIILIVNFMSTPYSLNDRLYITLHSLVVVASILFFYCTRKKILTLLVLIGMEFAVFYGGKKSVFCDIGKSHRYDTTDAPIYMIISWVFGTNPITSKKPASVAAPQYRGTTLPGQKANRLLSPDEIFNEMRVKYKDVPIFGLPFQDFSLTNLHIVWLLNQSSDLYHEITQSSLNFACTITNLMARTTNINHLADTPPSAERYNKLFENATKALTDALEVLTAQQDPKMLKTIRIMFGALQEFYRCPIAHLFSTNPKKEITDQTQQKSTFRTHKNHIQKLAYLQKEAASAEAAVQAVLDEILRLRIIFARERDRQMVDQLSGVIQTLKQVVAKEQAILAIKDFVMKCYEVRYTRKILLQMLESPVTFFFTTQRQALYTLCHEICEHLPLFKIIDQRPNRHHPPPPKRSLNPQSWKLALAYWHLFTTFPPLSTKPMNSSTTRSTGCSTMNPTPHYCALDVPTVSAKTIFLVPEKFTSHKQPITI
ncbi:hypothetical protein NEDG_01687 [Nematocida displodere]|uniref:Uncharacterized protein n=1 Tax=Nematocida displodere TaxID=1805483 RepID=A0A177EDR0_9MICR|nr:hypothetical protein NEDG_01687 [Nematocida displodere]